MGRYMIAEAPYDSDVVRRYGDPSVQECLFPVRESQYERLKFEVVDVPLLLSGRPQPPCALPILKERC